MTSWGLAQAKAHLSDLVHDAEKLGPQKITRSGRGVAVVVAMDEWEKVSGKAESGKDDESMAAFLLRSPLVSSGLEIKRVKLRRRKTAL